MGVRVEGGGEVVRVRVAARVVQAGAPAVERGGRGGGGSSVRSGGWGEERGGVWTWAALGRSSGSGSSS